MVFVNFVAETETNDTKYDVSAFWPSPEQKGEYAAAAAVADYDDGGSVRKCGAQLAAYEDGGESTSTSTCHAYSPSPSSAHESAPPCYGGGDPHKRGYGRDAAGAEAEAGYYGCGADSGALHGYGPAAGGEYPPQLQLEMRLAAAAAAAAAVARPPTFKRRNTANRKERRRTQSINNAFADLRDCIPNVPVDTKLSKIKTLRLATSYINYLMRVLSSDDPNAATVDGFKADLSSRTHAANKASPSPSACYYGPLKFHQHPFKCENKVSVRAFRLPRTPHTHTHTQSYEHEHESHRLPTTDYRLPKVHLPCLLYTSPSPRDRTRSRMPSSA